ncbi:exodeoxyribonuclease V, gamma subunit [Mycobacterium xenopi 4042]|uniref:Exodeoxyribonuclease V, gamma subunit n=1 Tax=Mycobacterium xenopi 4042 TaxID=1299334 RepID=X8BLC2_MYCXE|nr:exodeoxyribonuclease V, gamma subunit [Mycobacterium xenopi 4042]
MERWLSQRLSHVLGRAAAPTGVRRRGVSQPGSLIAEITGTVDDDPWSPEAMTWPLLEVIDCSLDQPWCEPLANTWATSTPTTRRSCDAADAIRWRAAAGLFASYARQRRSC